MAAGATYEPIATTTLGSATATVTFNSFSGYTDLVLIVNGTRTTNNGDMTIKVNNDTGSNYSFTRLTGDGSSAVSQASSNDTIGYTGVLSSSTRGAVIVQFQYYSNSTTYKTWLTRFNVTSDRVGAYANLWRSTSAITSIVVGCGADTFTSGSTFTLYGITAA